VLKWINGRVICGCVIHTYVCTYIHSMDPKCVTKTIGGGTRHKYTIFCSVKYYKHFINQYCGSSLHIKMGVVEFYKLILFEFH
jgi:hypothetical protein